MMTPVMVRGSTMRIKAAILAKLKLVFASLSIILLNVLCNPCVLITHRIHLVARKAFNPKALPAVSPHLHLGLINNCVLMLSALWNHRYRFP